jgi:lipopolysaccharide assembly outer membrane protein LptD (OstA)
VEDIQTASVRYSTASFSNTVNAIHLVTRCKNNLKDELGATIVSTCDIKITQMAYNDEDSPQKR